MDREMLSPKRKRTGRALSLKKSNALHQLTSTQLCSNVGSPARAVSDGALNNLVGNFSNGYSVQEYSHFQDNSPLKSRRYTGPTTSNSRSQPPEPEKPTTSISPRLTRGINSITDNGLCVRKQEETGILCETPPTRSPSTSFTYSQINTTVDSSSVLRRCDDTMISSLLSPGSPQSSIFMREAATERKSSGLEERGWPVRVIGSDTIIPRLRKAEFNSGNRDDRCNIPSSDYSPLAINRKGSYGGDSQQASSSSSMAPHDTVFKRPSFQCPGSENLRHTQSVEDEWRSSFEGDDGESDEEEKSGLSNSCALNRIRLSYPTRSLFEHENSDKTINSKFSDDDEHQQMDSNMSCMALHVGQEFSKGRSNSRTVFDCGPSGDDHGGPQFLSRRNKGGRNYTRDNPVVSDDSTSFVDALASSGHIGGNIDDVYNSRASFTKSREKPFVSKHADDDDDAAEMSAFENILCDDKGEWKSSPTRLETRKSRDGPYHLFSSSSFSPNDCLHTPARCAVAAAASMGDLGTPVTEAGSPADIDMGAAYDPYVPEGEGEGGHSGVFGYRSTRQSARHEEAFVKGRFHGCHSPDKPHPSRYRRDASELPTQAADGSCDESVSQHRQRRKNRVNSYDSAEYADAQHADDVAFRDRYADRNESHDKYHSASTDKEYSHLEDIYQQPQGVFGPRSDFSFTPTGGSSSAHSAVNPRPQPDQQAFNGGGKGGGGLGDCPSTPLRALSACPATPMRTPNWAAAERTASNTSDDDRVEGLEHHSLITRQNSLTTNKVLLSLSDTLDSSEVSFRRDFVEDGFLGSGNFADVYRVRERDGKSYAVKKSKRQFRSKKDRHLLMGEVMIMKKLGEVPCKHIVQLIRAWQEDGYFFVQIDLAERGTLKDLLMELAHKHTQPEDCTVWHVLHDVACGLQHIHKCGVVHLDVKPANLLISIDGVVKIGDFGTAADLGKGEDGHEGDSRYLAKETLNTLDRHPSADIYSLGITLYEICVSCSPQYRQAVEHGNPILPLNGDFWQELRNGEVPDPPDRCAALCLVIRAAMSPFDRPSAEEILALPDVLDISENLRPDVLVKSSLTTSGKTLPPMPARAASFKESMNTTHTHTPSQLLEAGNSSVAVPPPEDYERALTPTGANGSTGGAVSFWHQQPGRKWEGKDGLLKESVCALSIASTMEYSPAIACINASACRNIRDGINALDCSSSTDNSSSSFALDTSGCKYDCTDWTLLSPTQSTPLNRPESFRTLMSSSVSFPLPGSSRRREKVYAESEYLIRSKSTTFSPSSSPVSGNNGSIFRDASAPCPAASSASLVSKYRYTDSNSSGAYCQSPSAGRSISVGNVFSSAGLGGFRPGVPARTSSVPDTGGRSSNPLMRAGLEAVSNSNNSSGKER